MKRSIYLLSISLNFLFLLTNIYAIDFFSLGITTQLTEITNNEKFNEQGISLIAPDGIIIPADGQSHKLSLPLSTEPIIFSANIPKQVLKKEKEPAAPEEQPSFLQNIWQWLTSWFTKAPKIQPVPVQPPVQQTFTKLNIVRNDKKVSVHAYWTDNPSEEIYPIAQAHFGIASVLDEVAIGTTDVVGKREVLFYRPINNFSITVSPIGKARITWHGSGDWFCLVKRTEPTGKTIWKKLTIAQWLDIRRRPLQIKDPEELGTIIFDKTRNKMIEMLLKKSTAKIIVK